MEVRTSVYKELYNKWDGRYQVKLCEFNTYQELMDATGSGNICKGALIKLDGRLYDVAYVLLLKGGIQIILREHKRLQDTVDGMTSTPD